MNIDIIKKNLIIEIEKLIEIIKNEYPDLVDIPTVDLDECVHIEELGTISLYVRGNHFYFPIDAYDFFIGLEKIMDIEFYHKYMKYNFPGITGPIKKTKKYNDIDYTEAYRLIEEYKNKNKNHKK